MHSIILLLAFLFAPAPKPASDIPASIYDFKVTALDGKSTIDLSKYKGKKILIVNTASKCGFTPQYEGLQKLYKEQGGNLVIVGFPANNFHEQEPGTNEEITSFCQKNYGVTFPMAAKISVVGGDMAPIYQWLTKKQYNHYQDSEVKWNFQKYLINEKGELVGVFYSATTPDSKEIAEALKK